MNEWFELGILTLGRHLTGFGALDFCRISRAVFRAFRNC